MSDPTYICCDPGYVADGYVETFNPPPPRPIPLLVPVPNRLSMDDLVRISVTMGPAVNASVRAGLNAR